MTDLFILDNIIIAKHLRLYAQVCDLETVVFHSGVEGLQYLRSCSEETLPQAYLVDLQTRIQCGNPTFKCDLDIYPVSDKELSASLDIYNFLKQKNKVNNFYFMSTHISDQGYKILKQTNAKVIGKGSDELFNTIKKLKTSSTFQEM